MITDKVCQKMQFDTKKDARDWINGLRHSKRCDHKKLRIYHCPNCETYHLTTLSKNQNKRITKWNKQ